METADKKLKVGVVGLGKMGLVHASILSVIPNVQLVALCDKSWVMRKLAKRTLKQSFVTDKLGELAKMKLDVAYVTTPIPSHHSIVKEIYNMNIAPNVFVEKTLSSSYAESEELCILADKSSGRNMVGYMKRFSVTFQRAKELLNQGVLGTLNSFDAYAYSSDFFGVQKGGVTGARGGVLEDLGSHVCDLALWLFDNLLTSIEVSSSNDPKSDSVHFEIACPTDFTGRFAISWVQDGYRMPEFGLTIYGAKGVMKVDDSTLILTLDHEQPKTWHRQDLDDHVSFLLGDSEYFRETDHFIKAILCADKSEPSFRTAMKVDQLLEAVRCRNNE